MKENKYKLWRKSESKWIDEGWVITSDGEVVLYVNGGNIIGYCNMDYHILVAYTGMKDCKGKEIYEGDIVEITDMMPIDRYFGKSYICEVVWSEDGCILKDYKGGGSDKISKTSSIPNFKEINVIGNIYEDKELLEE